MPDLPYTSLASHLRAHFGRRVQKISLDASLGCPNRDNITGSGGCIYCNASGSGTGAALAGLSIADQLTSAKERIRKRYGTVGFLAYFQSWSNTFAPVERLRELYDAALADPDVLGLAVGTRPDCVPDEVLDLLAEYRDRTYLWVEYGLQSAHDATLATINRGHDVAAFDDALERTRARDIPVVAHIMLGLPGETPADMRTTARFLAARDIQGVKPHLTYVVRDTELARMHERGEYIPLTREEYVDAICDLISRLPRHVVIHRLTGDPHPDELVVPLWALEKNRNLEAIRTALRDRGIRQGDMADAPE
jgi:uncharacterized protein